VPLFDTDFGPEEHAAVIRVLDSGWLTMGEETKSFEREFAEYLGVRHAFLVSNCTAALHLAHHVLGAGPGDEIICPSLTFVATANSIIQAGATPVFADIATLDDLTISPREIERLITPRTRGISVMHYGGYVCAMEEILAIARRHGLYLVEDCAHSPGASLNGVMTGTFGDIGCFSFFSNKNLSTGEGGMLVTDRDDLAERIRLLRSHGMTTVTLDRHKGHAFSYDVVEHGFNYRSAELNAALGRVQLRKLEEKNRRRRDIVARYHERLAGLTGLTVPFGSRPTGEIAAAHIFPVLLAEQADRNEVMIALRDRGVQTSIHYRPVHTFTAFSNSAATASLPVTAAAGMRLITLPLFPTMTDSQFHHVVSTVATVMGEL
jgi:dTDP-4-amino-4,6-dideoxygalactose transaminase